MTRPALPPLETRRSQVEKKKILLIGYGNPARGDDGLGPALAAGAARLGIPGLHVETPFQLSVEDALLVAEHEEVIFADATLDGPEPFSFLPQEGEEGRETFTTHSVQPGSLVALAEELFSSRPRAWVLGIRGYEFEMFTEKLTPRAEKNLQAALRFLASRLGCGGFPEAPAGDKLGEKR